jgi:hypothetical protein
MICGVNEVSDQLPDIELVVSSESIEGNYFYLKIQQKD